MSTSERIDALAADSEATISVWMGAVDGRPWLVREADTEHPAASTLKLPLLIAVYAAYEQGRLDLDEHLHVHDTFASAADGASFTMTEDYDNDPEPWKLLGEHATIGWLARRASILSSNLATTLLIERVGRDPVNAVYDNVGAKTARLRRGIQDEPASDAGLFNTATAHDMAQVLVGLVNDRFTTAPTTSEIEGILAACETNDAIPAGLPSGTYVAHKTGWIDGACHDVAIVRPADREAFVLSIYTGADLDEAPLHALAARVATACWEGSVTSR